MRKEQPSWEVFKCLESGSITHGKQMQRPTTRCRSREQVILIRAMRACPILIWSVIGWNGTMGFSSLCP
jgi:hypothetical protein